MASTSASRCARRCNVASTDATRPPVCACTFNNGTHGTFLRRQTDPILARRGLRLQNCPGGASRHAWRHEGRAHHPALLVGNDTKDDAAVVDLGDGTAIISTTDFFMPIVDDPHTFGRIAAANAISDIYAMGGTPLVAIAIFGWPIDKLSEEVAGQVLEGGRSICEEAGIPLAGGHSIDCPEPIFGLAVTGRVPLEQLQRTRRPILGTCCF